MPWALAWAKDTFRYVGHCGLVFDNFDFLDRGILAFDLLDRGVFEVFGIFGILEIVILILMFWTVGFWELGFWNSYF